MLITSLHKRAAKFIFELIKMGVINNRNDRKLLIIIEKRKCYLKSDIEKPNFENCLVAIWIPSGE